MKTALLSILKGIALNLNVFGSPIVNEFEYEGNPHDNDHKAIIGDMQIIGDDMNTALKMFEKEHPV